MSVGESSGGLRPLSEADGKHGAAEAVLSMPINAKILLLLGGGLAAYLVLFLYAVIHSVIFTPFADPHDWDAAVFAAERSGRWLSYLWEPHTNQHIVFVRMLTWLDVTVLGRMRISAFPVATVAALFASTGALATAIVRSVRDATLAAVLSTLAAMVLVCVAAGEDCSFPVFSVYVFVSAFAAMAACALAFSEGAAGRVLFVAALACGVLSGFGNAAGLAIWPVLAYAVWRRRDPVWRLAAVILVGVAYVAVNIHGLGAPSSHLGEMDLRSPAHLLKMTLYFTGYCALPWSGGGGARLLARLVGLTIAIAGLHALCRRPAADAGLARIQRIGQALILFGLATAVLATIGRVDENPNPDIPTRYFPFAALLQVGLLLAFAGPLAALWRTHRRAFGGAVAVFVCVALLQQAVGAGHLIRAANRVRAASAAFDAGARSPQVMFLVYPDADKAVAVRAELKRRGLAF